VGAFCLAIPTVLFGVRGYWDINQSKHAVLANFPVLGHLRYILESIRPEIRQYFIESDEESAPFSRNQRALVYQRAKGDNDNNPFGTRRDTGAEGYEYLTHSLYPKPPIPIKSARVVFGEGSSCAQVSQRCDS
jgi:glutamate synthase domain-containing protein 2